MPRVNDVELLREVIAMGVESASGEGGPFGALVATDGGRVVGRGTNRVVNERDPTLHAEVVAIREACRSLGTHDLSGTVLYASCEPCPMCFGAAYWARVDRIVHAASRADAAAAGFDDAAIHADVARPPAERELATVQLLAEDGWRPFAAWAANPTRVPY
jgi:tRNA(Arg) A34 adenosine deaminase TadA